MCIDAVMDEGKERMELCNFVSLEPCLIHVLGMNMSGQVQQILPV